MSDSGFKDVDIVQQTGAIYPQSSAGCKPNQVNGENWSCACAHHCAQLYTQYSKEQFR